MTAREMFDLVLLKAGQFVIPPDHLEVDIDKFAMLVKYTLTTYNRYVPRDKYITVDCNGSRHYEFTEENTEDGIPDNIVEAIPMRVSGVRPFLLRDDYKLHPQLEIRYEFPIVYRKPVLTVPVNGLYDCLAVFYHKITPLDPPDTEGRKDFEVTTLSDIDDDAFFDLLTARFMLALGKSRKAFTLNALQISTDASEMNSEGKSMEKDALDDIRTNKCKFYLAWG